MDGGTGQRLGEFALSGGGNGFVFGGHDDGCTNAGSAVYAKFADPFACVVSTECETRLGNHCRIVVPDLIDHPRGHVFFADEQIPRKQLLAHRLGCKGKHCCSEAHAAFPEHAIFTLRPEPSAGRAQYNAVYPRGVSMRSELCDRATH